jgi:hypothetical protein
MEDEDQNISLKKISKRKNVSRAEKDRHIQLWKKSRLSRFEFCQQQGLNPRTFAMWLWKAKKENKSKISFLPLIQGKESTVEETKLDVKLPNGMICQFSLTINTQQVVQMIRELHDAFVND